MCVEIFSQESICFVQTSIQKEFFLCLWAGGKGWGVSPGTQGFVGTSMSRKYPRDGSEGEIG